MVISPASGLTLGMMHTGGDLIKPLAEMCLLPTSVTSRIRITGSMTQGPNTHIEVSVAGLAVMALVTTAGLQVTLAEPGDPCLWPDAWSDQHTHSERI